MFTINSSPSWFKQSFITSLIFSGLISSSLAHAGEDRHGPDTQGVSVREGFAQGLTEEDIHNAIKECGAKFYRESLLRVFGKMNDYKFVNEYELGVETDKWLTHTSRIEVSNVHRTAFDFFAKENPNKTRDESFFSFRNPDGTDKIAAVAPKLSVLKREKPWFFSQNFGDVQLVKFDLFSNDYHASKIEFDMIKRPLDKKNDTSKVSLESRIPDWNLPLFIYEKFVDDIQFDPILGSIKSQKVKIIPRGIYSYCDVIQSSRTNHCLPDAISVAPLSRLYGDNTIPTQLTLNYQSYVSCVNSSLGKK